MKRLIVLLLAFAMCLSLCGCNSREKRAVLAVEASIDAIGTVTEDSGRDILVAETMYRGLSTESQRSQVKNYHVLQQARREYDELMAATPLTTANFTEYFKIKNEYGKMSGEGKNLSVQWFIDISPVHPGKAWDVEVKLKVTAPDQWALSSGDKAYKQSFANTGEFTLTIQIPEDGHYNSEHVLATVWGANIYSNCKIEVVSVSGLFKEN